ncbi:hypothetical protein ACSBR1_004943 [Camellia fascicularis]
MIKWPFTSKIISDPIVDWSKPPIFDDELFIDGTNNLFNHILSIGSMNQSYGRDDVPWCMLFVDDIVVVDETKEGVKTKLEIWRKTLESKGFRISKTKTEYMKCNFSNSHNGSKGELKIENQELPKSEHFHYLGSIITIIGEIRVDVVHRIKAGWLKWRSASGVLCDKRVPIRLKGKFYRTTIRPMMLYEMEYWATKKQHVDKMSVAEIRMLRWMYVKTRKDKVRNEYIREWVGVVLIEDKLRKNRLRWFGHIQRRPTETVVKRCDTVTVDGSVTGRGRPRLTWTSIVNKDMNLFNLTNEMALDRVEWRRRIHAADPI